MFSKMKGNMLKITKEAYGTSLQTVTAATTLKDASSLEGKSCPT